MKQLRELDATFLYLAAFRATMQAMSLSAVEPRGNFGECPFERFKSDLAFCTSHLPLSGHDSEAARLPERRGRWPCDRRPVAARAASCARGKAVLSRRDRGAALPRSEAMSNRK